MEPSFSTLRNPPGDALSAASIGIAPILWGNVDLADLRHATTSEATTSEAILEKIARIVYHGTQRGTWFREGAALCPALKAMYLQPAEVCVTIPAMIDGRDTSWPSSSESAAVGRRVLASAGGRLGTARVA